MNIDGLIVKVNNLWLNYKEKLSKDISDIVIKLNKKYKNENICIRE